MPDRTRRSPVRIEPDLRQGKEGLSVIQAQPGAGRVGTSDLFQVYFLSVARKARIKRRKSHRRTACKQRIHRPHHRQPFLRRESLEKLVRLWEEQPDKIAALGHGGVRGNPCLFPARFFPELLELREDHGGNTVIRRHQEDLILLDVSPEELTDVDTPEALEALRHES